MSLVEGIHHCEDARTTKWNEHMEQLNFDVHEVFRFNYHKLLIYSDSYILYHWMEISVSRFETWMIVRNWVSSSGCREIGTICMVAGGIISMSEPQD